MLQLLQFPTVGGTGERGELSLLFFSRMATELDEARLKIKYQEEGLEAAVRAQEE